MSKEFKGMVDTNIKSALSSKVVGTQDSNCLRFQFLELLVRMAISKYQESKRAQTPFDAVKMLLRKDILPNVDEIKEKWEGFRQKQLWTLEVNEMFEANKPMIV